MTKRTNDLISRPYVAGEEAGILALFREVFGRDLEAEFWKWRFASNPTNITFIELMWSGSQLAGHYAASPSVLRGPDGDFLSALSMTTMTAPAFQGRGVFQRLAESLYARMASAGVGMVWGFPNANSHRGFVKDLGWQDIYEIPNFRLERRPSQGGVVLQLEDVTSFDDRADALWNRIAPSLGPVSTRRDQKYLNWRYANHPTNRYSISIVSSGASLDGFIVSKRYGDSVDIVDLLASDHEIAFQMVCAVASSVAQEVNSVNMWLPLTHPLHGRLERIGFTVGGPVTYFGARRLGPSAPDAAFDYKSWYLTMGDSDVY